MLCGVLGVIIKADLSVSRVLRGNVECYRQCSSVCGDAVVL